MTKDITHMFLSIPSYLSVTMETSEAKFIPNDLIHGEGGNISVTIHSTIHVYPNTTMPHSWSQGFVHKYRNQWAGDIMRFIIESYGLTLDPPSYS